MASKKPSERQIWVMYKMSPYGVVTLLTLQQAFESPFSVCNYSVAERFMKSMISQGWIEDDYMDGFYRLTEKAAVWIKENPESKAVDNIDKRKLLLG